MTPAERMRQYRQRLRRRVSMRRVQINSVDTPIELVRAGYLDAEAIDDPKAQDEAISVLIARWTKERRYA